MASYAATTGWPTATVWWTPWPELEAVAIELKKRSGGSFTKRLTSKEQGRKEAALALARRIHAPGPPP